MVGTKIYHKERITYIVANDPEDKKVPVEGMGVHYIVPEGEEDAGLISRFEVYIDISPVLTRWAEVNV